MRKIYVYQIRINRLSRCPGHFDKRKNSIAVIIRMKDSFRVHGTVKNLDAKGNSVTHSGRWKSAGTEENIAAAMVSVDHSPKKSFRRHSQQLHILRKSLGEF